MKKILKPKGTGKTTDLIKLSAETKINIVCLDSERVLQVQKQAKTLKIDIPKVMSWKDFIYSKDDNKGKSILIDNADDILQNLCYPIKLEAITLTTDD
jgi:flagellar biosynthesis GTPase FlhF